MSDDLDDLLRRAMKTLDDQVPPGYFEALPAQTLARLEDGSIEDEPLAAIAASSSAEAIAAVAAVAAPAAAAASEPAPAEAAGKPRDRDEDSGLHDIRSLASSQRMRLSKRASQPSIKSDDELLAAASGSWRGVALPEPAKMVAPAEPAEAKPAREAKAWDSKKKLEPARDAAAAVEPASVTPITAARKAKHAATGEDEDRAKPAGAPAAAAAGRKGGRNALIAGAGLALAAAAAAVIVVSTDKSGDSAQMQAAPAAQGEGADLQLPELRRVEPAARGAAEPAAATAGSAAVETVAPLPEPVVDPGKAPPPGKPTKSVGKHVPNVVEDGKAPEKPAPDGTKTKRKPEEGDPDFDKLLKEAGYQEKKGDGPKLERKALSGDDIKKSMNGVSGKVQSCYAGQEGTAAVKLTVAPTGKVQKVTVSGVFAGTPVGACVEAAVQMAAFPPWDGGPQSFGYSYLLAE